jgi:hypothetical protein
MKRTLFFLFAILLFTSCDYRKREEALRIKEAALKQKEQELALKERSLQLKEEDLLKREKRLDSTATEGTYIVDSALIGNWSVKMVCTETTCTGSAVGDTKTESWQITYQANSIIAKVSSNNQLIRIYTGFYTGNTIELVEAQNKEAAASQTKMVVRLRVIDSTHLEGQREILRENCKVIYSLQLGKENS